MPRSPRAPVMVVYTKADLVSESARAQLAQTGVPVSLEIPDSLDNLLRQVAARLPEGPFQYDPDDLAAQPLRFFVVEFLREAAFTLLRDELPYSFTAEVEEFREAEEPVVIRATLYVERESQKGILIGAGGRTIRDIGRHARERLESLMGRQVFLETWVKVLPKWRRDPAQLRRFGLGESR